jgi:VCBS repeat-containing protein
LINGTNDNSVVDKVASLVSGTVHEDAAMSTILGHLDISDVDSSNHTITVDLSHDAKYGTFSLQGDTWVYTLDNNNPDVNNLFTGDKLQDTITLKIDDGNGGVTTQDINVEIDGHSLLLPTGRVQADEPLDDIMQDAIDQAEAAQHHNIIPDEVRIGMPNLDNVVQHLEAQKTGDVVVPQEHQDALATVATLLGDTQTDSKEAHIIKAVENQEPKEHTPNPHAVDTTAHGDVDHDATIIDHSAAESEHADYVPDHHNQMPDDHDLNDGTGITG